MDFDVILNLSTLLPMKGDVFDALDTSFNLRKMDDIIEAKL